MQNELVLVLEHTYCETFLTMLRYVIPSCVY